MRYPRASVAVVAASLVLSLSACNSQPGTAAYVGSSTVTVDALQAQVDAVVAYRSGPGAIKGTDVRSQLPMITQQVLSQDILHEMVADAVARTGFKVDEADVAKQITELDAKTVLSQPAQAHLTEDTLKVLLRDQIVLAQLGKRAWDGLAVSIDLVPEADRSAAVSTATAMAASDAASKAAVTKAKAAGKQSQAGLDLSPASIGGPQSPAAGLLATPLFSAPQGSGVAFSLTPPSQSGQPGAPQWFAVRIVKRSTDAPTSAESGAVTAAQAPLNATLSLGLTLLPQLSGDQEVRLNPRYGKYDPAAGRVISDSDVLSAVVIGD
ncbi:MAG: hypothetical protein ABI181_02395 [Mycobacteriaceae bacterium]